MRKRERENPCPICNHYHKYEEGEPCGTCGHRMIGASEKGPQQSAFSTEVLTDFLYLGSYDNASRAELLKSQGITRILNTVPSCQNLYKNSFTYYCVKEDTSLPFDECVQFIDECEKANERVLVHCMLGQNRSPAIVIAYLMRRKGWRLPESFQWVKDRRPSIQITHGVAEQLQQYEAQTFGCVHTPILTSPEGDVAFGFGYSNPLIQLSQPSFGVPLSTQSPTGAAMPVFHGASVVSASSVGSGFPSDGTGQFVFGAGGQSVNGFPLHRQDEEGMDGS